MIPLTPSPALAPARDLSPVVRGQARRKGSSQGRRHPLPSWVRWFALLLQFALFLVPVQASGVFHVVADIVATVAGEQVHHGEPPCSHEKQGKRCPPGCSDCHCALAAPTLPPRLELVGVPRAVQLSVVSWLPDALAPPRPVVSGLERPPRHAPFA